MKSIYDAFGVDEKTQKEGAVLDFGDFGSFRIAYAGTTNKRYEQLITARTKPYRRAIQTESLPAKQQEQILREVYAECIVLGWDGVKGKDGKEMKFNRENCIKLLTDLPVLFTEIQQFATNHSVFRKELEEADAKNSKSS